MESFVTTEFDRVMREQGRKGTWMAEKLGCSVALVTYVRQGRRRPSPEFKARAAMALGVPVDELFADLEASV